MAVDIKMRFLLTNSPNLLLGQSPLSAVIQDVPLSPPRPFVFHNALTMNWPYSRKFITTYSISASVPFEEEFPLSKADYLQPTRYFSASIHVELPCHAKNKFVALT